MEAATARGEISRAVRLWHDAHALARASRQPEALLAAGESFLRLSATAGTPGGGKPSARRAYLAALMHAERQRSAPAVLRLAEAFRALGDGQAADYCVRIAEALAAPADRR